MRSFFGCKALFLFSFSDDISSITADETDDQLYHGNLAIPIIKIENQLHKMIHHLEN